MPRPNILGEMSPNYNHVPRKKRLRHQLLANINSMYSIYEKHFPILKIWVVPPPSLPICMKVYPFSPRTLLAHLQVPSQNPLYPKISPKMDIESRHPT